MTKSVTHDDSSRRRFLTGLLGAPIAQSAAPAMHERAAEALGLHCHYQLIEIAGAGRDELKLLLEGIRRLGFAGINVTFPYKEAVLELLDELSPGAARIGAVNTVVVRDNRLIGHNTDTSGFARAIAELVAGSSRGAVALIGAGGVGKAIAFALAALGVADLRIFDCEHAKAEHLAARLEGETRARATDSVEDALQGVVGVVNASPVGMLPDRGTPVPEAPAACRAMGRGRGLFAAVDAAAQRRQGEGRQGHDRARACDLSGRRRVRTVHRLCAVRRRDGNGIRRRDGETIRRVRTRLDRAASQAARLSCR